MTAPITLRVGTRLVRDGSLWEVVEFAGSGLALKNLDGRISRTSIVHLLSEPGLRQVADEDAGSPEKAVDAELSALTAAEQRKVRTKVAHIREMLTGYRSGYEQFAEPNEPRPAFNETVPLMQRYRSKAEELQVGLSTLRRWTTAYQQSGPLGLANLDPGPARRSASNRVDPRWLAAARAEIEFRIDKSRPNKKLILREISAKLEREYGFGIVPCPGKNLGYSVLAELSQGTNAFVGSTKDKRSIENRPKGAYGRLAATRPGEYLMLDTNYLDVFAMDPRTLQWHGVELTVAMDLYSRAIVGLCVSPTTKSVDVAWVLREALDPSLSAGDDALAYVGHPTKIFLNETKVVNAAGVSLLDKNTGQGNAMTPFLPSVTGEAIIVDHGKVFVSDHVYSVCERQGISVQPARPYTPTDKAPVERFFRTLKDNILVALPGYKGADVASRGKAVEEDAFYFMDELEKIIREWVVEVYHHSPHEGLCVPEVPGLKMSPLNMLEHGIARAGHLRVPARADWGFDWLKSEWRTIQHYGVEIFGLRYNGDALNPYRNKKSQYAGAYPGKWPIHHDPRDVRHVWFQDPADNAWHTLTWEHLGSLNQPFGLDAIRVARRLARQEMRYPDDAIALERLLSRWESGRAANASERRKAVEYGSRHGLLHPGDEIDENGENGDGQSRRSSAQRSVAPQMTNASSITNGRTDLNDAGQVEIAKSYLTDALMMGDDDDQSDLTAGAPDEDDEDYYSDAMELL